MTPSELDELAEENRRCGLTTREVEPLIAALREAWAEIAEMRKTVLAGVLIARAIDEKLAKANKVVAAAQVAIKGRGCECDKCLAFLAALAEFDRSTGGGT